MMMKLESQSTRSASPTGGARMHVAARGFLLVGAALLAAGCATPLALQPGTPGAEVKARFGRPSAEYLLPDAARRLSYSKLPFGQTSFMVELDPSGRVVRAWQALTDAQFAELRVGVDTEQTVLRAFGPPAAIRRFGRSDLKVYQYPYKEAGVWDSQMSLSFDPAGVLRQLENGPDPWREINGGRDRGEGSGMR